MTSRRAEYAAATKRAIEDAARELFVRHGYRGTTVDMIAKEARVAPATVYAVAGGKQGLLRTVIESATTSPERVAVKEQLSSSDDPAELLRYLARQTRLTFEDWRGMMRVVAETASQEPAAAEGLRIARESRRDGFTRTAQRLQELGALRTGLSVARAADVIWFYQDNAAYYSLVDDNGWSPEDAEEFLHEQLRSALL